jgi:hypothetical protein
MNPWRHRSKALSVSAQLCSVEDAAVVAMPDGGYLAVGSQIPGTGTRETFDRRRARGTLRDALLMGGVVSEPSSGERDWLLSQAGRSPQLDGSWA